MKTTLRLDTRGLLTPALDETHALSPADIDALAPRVADIVARIEKDRPAGKRRYRDLPSDAAMLQSVRAMTKKHKPGCENLLVLGIGGSALGNIALQTALNPLTWNLLPASVVGQASRLSTTGESPTLQGTHGDRRDAGPSRNGPRLFVMDNVDPAQFAALLDLIDAQLDRTCVNVISKSGETAETAAQFLIVRDLLEKRLGAAKARERFVVTTDPSGGTMRDIVRAANYDSLEVPPGVGGRFSVLSPVGLFSAAMCGIDIEAVLGGAAAMSQAVASPVLRDNPAAMIAVIHFLYYQFGKRIHVMMPYSAHLKDLADWYRQLWAESLGKKRSLDGRDVFVGPTPVKALGATDQHSQVQLYREGPNDKVFTFLVVENFGRDVPIPRSDNTPGEMKYLAGASLGKLLNAEQAATQYALTQSGRPCLAVRFPAVTPQAVGEFFMLYEAATSITGLLMDIDAYDQPAVQAGKEGTFALMGRQGYEELALKIRG